MTTLIAARGPDSITLYSDGGAFDPATGAFGQVSAKVSMLPHLPAIVAGRGDGHCTVSVAAAANHFECFDDLVTGMESVFAEAVEFFGAQGQTNFGFLICGYSAAREAWETYWIYMGHELDGTAIEGSCELHQKGWFFSIPEPGMDELEAAGVLTEDGRIRMQGEADMLAYVEAIRATPLPMGQGPDAPVGCLASAFLQRTVVTSEGVTSSVIHRWPDRLGEKINPREAKQSNDE